MEVETETKEPSGNTGATNVSLERTNQLAGCSQKGLACQVGTVRSALILVLLTHRNDEGLSTGRGGTSGWKESWFYERSLKALGLFSLEK